MRVAFLGTPEFAVPVLQALHGPHEVVQVISRADRRRSRRGQPEASPVKAAAIDLGIPVSSRPTDVISAGAERGVVVAFGRIIKPDVLAAVPMLNLHLSLLPRWRGAAPVQRALLAGDAQTGVSLMELDEGLDTGPVHQAVATSILQTDTTESLTARLVELGTPILLEALAGDPGQPAPQDGEMTYAEKLSPGELRLVWTESAELLHRQVRVGGAWAEFRGQRVVVTEASVSEEGLADGSGPTASGSLTRVASGVSVQTGHGRLVLQKVKPAGRKEQSALDWWNGLRADPTELLQ